MSFDVNDAADLLALKTEVNDDPISMGYASVVDITQQLLKLLNDPANNVNSDVADRVFTAESMMDALDPTDYDAQQTVAGTPDYVHTLVEMGGSAGIDISTYKAKFRSMFAVNSGTVVALDAQTSPLSRAEVLFGQGTTLTRNDWIAARSS